MNETYFRVPSGFLGHVNEIGPATTRVYLQLCSRLSSTDSSTTISAAGLADLTGLDQRTVFSALAQLRSLDLIAQRRDRPTSVNEYSLPLADECTGDDAESRDHVLATSASETLARQAEEEHAAPIGISEPNVHGQSTQGGPVEKPVESLDHLVAAVHSPRFQVAHLEPYIDLNEADLRECLEWVRSQGGVAPDMPITFLARVLVTARRKLCPP